MYVACGCLCIHAHVCVRWLARELVQWRLGAGVSPLLLGGGARCPSSQLQYKQAMKPWTRAPDIFLSLEFKDEQ